MWGGRTTLPGRWRLDGRRGGVYNPLMLRDLWLGVRQLLLPAHCAACGTPSPPDGRLPLCEACGRRLAALMEAGHCRRCGRGAGPYASDETGCAACRKDRPRYDAAVRVGPYVEPLRSLVLRYKYERRAEMGAVLGRLLGERLAAAPWADAVEVVVPVPLHWTRRVRRGFNQADLLARELVRACRRAAGRAVGRRLLRVRATPHQTRLSATRRAANVRGAFRVRGGADGVWGRHILIVDDVLTSGSTAEECARTLKAAGAAAVYVAVVAVAGREEQGPW